MHSVRTEFWSVKAFPLPADELILLEVKTLQTKAEGLPSEKLDCFYESGIQTRHANRTWKITLPH